MEFILTFAVGFICGMIPFSYILGRLKGVDIRSTGSGNIGATNLGRECGFSFFVLGFLLDGMKGLIPVLIAKATPYPAVLTGVGSIIGHIFNPLFSFKGGKGISTTIGVAIGLVPKSFSISLAVWIITYLITYIVSLASLGLATILPVLAFVLREGALADRILITLMAILLFYAHRSNIKRLLKGKELKTVIWRKR